MPREGVNPGKGTPAAPFPAELQGAAADEPLLAEVKPLVAFAVVLPGEGLAAHGAFEGSLVAMRAQVRAQVVRSCKPPRA